jgi:hypothetical protein
MSVTEPIQIPIEGNADDFIADAKKVQAEMDKMSARLKEAGVSQSAYNKAVSNSKQAMKEAAQATNDATKAAQSQVAQVKQTSMSWTDFRSMYQTVLDVVRVGQQVWQATGQEFVNYAEQVKNLSRNIGVTAEDASRLIQVADDVRISYESIGTATKIAQKQGIDVSIEGLKKLAAQYKSLPAGIERSQFLLKTFGKSGLEMGKLMEKGADGIDQMSKAVEGNLVLTKEAIQISDDYQASVDTLGDAWKGFLMGPAQGVVKWLGDSAKGWAYQLKLTQLVKDRGVSMFDNKAVQALTVEAYNLVNAEYDLKRSSDEAAGAMDDNSGALDDNKTAVNEAKYALNDYQKQLEEVSKANVEMANMTQKIASDQRTYEAEHNTAVANRSEKEYEYAQAVKEHGKASKEALTSLGDIDIAIEGINTLEASWHEASTKMIADMVLVKLSEGGLLDSELKAYEDYAVSKGLQTQADVDESRKRRDLADADAQYILDSENVKNEQMKIDAETLALTDAVASAEVIASNANEAASMGAVSQATQNEIQNQQRLAEQARITAGAYAMIRMPAMLPTGISKAQSDPRRGRGANVQYALGGEFMIPMGYGNEGFNMGGMATASGGETVTITPKGKDKGGGGITYIINISNPKREAAEDSIRSALRNLSYTGSAA